MNTPRTFPGLRPARGFTLVELLVAVAVLGTLIVIAVPQLGKVVDSMKLTSLSNSVLSQLHMARSEAIKRNGRVALCKSADGERCSRGGGWEQGWIVFDDRNNNGERGAQETVVYRATALPAGFVLQGNQTVARYLSFAQEGGTRTTSGAFQAGTFTLCRQGVDSSEARQIVINAVGRPRIQRTHVNQCA